MPKAELERVPRNGPFIYFYDSRLWKSDNITDRIIPVLNKIDSKPVGEWEWLKMSKEDYRQKAQMAEWVERCMVCGQPTKRKSLCPHHRGAYTKWRLK
jgi:hypothetical protein